MFNEEEVIIWFKVILMLLSDKTPVLLCLNGEESLLERLTTNHLSVPRSIHPSK